MTPRCLLITLLSVGCAAAVPAAHGLFGDDHDSMFAKWHGAHGGGLHGPDAVRARIDAALDQLGLEPDVRAKVEAILEPRIGDAFALHERLESGEIDRETALAEHEKLLTAARSDLAPVLTTEQIDRFFAALHPQGACMLER